MNRAIRGDHACGDSIGSLSGAHLEPVRGCTSPQAMCASSSTMRSEPAALQPPVGGGEERSVLGLPPRSGGRAHLFEGPLEVPSCGRVPKTRAPQRSPDRRSRAGPPDRGRSLPTFSREKVGRLPGRDPARPLPKKKLHARQLDATHARRPQWVPAFAGMTSVLRSSRFPRTAVGERRDPPTSGAQDVQWAPAFAHCCPGKRWEIGERPDPERDATDLPMS